MRISHMVGSWRKHVQKVPCREMRTTFCRVMRTAHSTPFSFDSNANTCNFPLFEQAKSKRGRKSMSSTILTNPESRAVLQEKADKKQAKKGAKVGKTKQVVEKKAKNKGPAKKARKKRVESSSSDKDVDFCMLEFCKKLIPKRLAKSKIFTCPNKECGRTFHSACVAVVSNPVFRCPACSPDEDVSEEMEYSDDE